MENVIEVLSRISYSENAYYSGGTLASFKNFMYIGKGDVYNSRIRT